MESLLWADYLPSSVIFQQTTTWRDSVLGVAQFGLESGSRMYLGGLPSIVVDMSVLGGAPDLCEVWHCGEPLQGGEQGGIEYRRGEHVLFGCLSRTVQDDLLAHTEAAYNEIFQLLDRLEYNSVLRFWNYFPAINVETRLDLSENNINENACLERYRQFNVGRQNAFLAHGRSVIGNVPAACALGSASGNLNIAFLAVRADVAGIENPRQLSAYLYPSEYGPRSPTFSRAGLVQMDGRDMLFVSGTASIVGHQTLHPDDVAAQTRESMNNIDAVVEEARRQAPNANFSLFRLVYKVYIRHPSDMGVVRQEIEHYVGGPVQAVYLKADICRSDLLVEIEASGGHPTIFN